MIGTKVDRVGETHQRRVAHQVANASVSMGRRVVEIFPILDSDEVGKLRRVVQTPVPAGQTTAPSESRVQLPVLVVRDGLELEIDVVRAPRPAERLVSLRSRGVGAR